MMAEMAVAGATVVEVTVTGTMITGAMVTVAEAGAMVVAIAQVRLAALHQDQVAVVLPLWIVMK